nr:MAG TPA: resistance protein [Caudoviricetes sp.]
MDALYNITNKIIDLMDKTENEELTEEEQSLLSQEVEKELINKSSSIIAYVQNNEALSKAIDDEIDRLTEMKKKLKNKTDKFKEQVLNNMDRLGIEKVTTNIGKLAVRKNPISVEILNENIVPDEFKKEVVKTTIDKAAIKNYFKETGKIIPGTVINTEKYSLRIENI